ncbi:MAG: hypothetical protein IJ088_13060 [Clostridia bacterium]|nr:hypothetical protein [Clostridia bacterium]
MNEILAEQVNRPERLSPRAFFVTLVRMALRLAVVEIVTTVLAHFLHAPVLNLLFYAYAVAEVLLFLRRVLASDRYRLTADRLLLERRMGDMVLLSLSVPTNRMATVREYAAGEKLSVSYAHVTHFRRRDRVPVRVRLAWPLAYISTRLAARCAGRAADNRCGLLLAYYEGSGVRACTFEPDVGMLGALSKVLGDRMGTDDRLARPHLRTFKARIQAKAFPALYPHVVPLVTPEDEEWARNYMAERKRAKALKEARKKAQPRPKTDTKRPKKRKGKPAKGRPGTGQMERKSAPEVPENEPAARSMEIPEHPVIVEVEYAPEKRKDVRRRRSGTRVEDEDAGKDSIF